jgi:hypothetical protein
MKNRRMVPHDGLSTLGLLLKNIWTYGLLFIERGMIILISFFIYFLIVLFYPAVSRGIYLWIY